MVTFLRRCFSIAAIALLVVCAMPQHVFASYYGSDNYGSCNYQADCAAADDEPESTEVTLPSGLEVSINLVDGQTIPKSGYTITVTPLNGRGSSFQKADFYINGVFAGTATPAVTGTAEWFWDPSRFPGTNVRVVVTDTDGTITKEFRVVIGEVVPPGTTTPTTPKTETPSPLQKFYNGAENFIRSLPKPIIYGFPYLLFILLAAYIVFLLLQTHRELREYHTLQALLARERAVSEAKRTLLELIAHYLRTPLTILLGGIEMLGAGATIGAAASLPSIGQRLKTSIELFLEQARTAITQAVISSGQSSTATPAWRHPGLFLPLLLIAIIVIPFNYLAQHADALDGSQVNFFTQTLIYILLAVLAYEVFRRRQLRRRDTSELERVTHEELSVAKTRDDLVASAAATLQADILSLDQVAAQLPQTPANKFVLDSSARFHTLLTKVTVATQLRGSQSTDAPTATELTALLSKVTEAHSATAAQRSVSIKAVNDLVFSVRNPELLAYVLGSLIENAVSYGPDGNVVQVGAATTPQGMTITVTDSGTGISADKLPLLFQPFSKTEGAEVFTHEGMGFSLYLDKLIMEYLGGTITLTSQPGNGTAVTLTLPTLAVPATTEQY